MGYLPGSRSLSLTTKSIVHKGASGPGTPSTPVGVEKRPASRSVCKHRADTVHTSLGFHVTAHMRGLGAMRRFPGCPPSREPALPLRRLLRKSLSHS